MADGSIAIIGPGRMGRGLALALASAGRGVTLLGRRERVEVPNLIWPSDRWPTPVAASRMVLIAVPDGSIGDVATHLAASASIGSEHVVLHLSGLLDREALAPLGVTGAGLGSLHPLQTVADPALASERLRGAYAGVEGDARAIEGAEVLARAIGMRPVRIPTGGKADYHLGATFVANYAASLLAVGEGMARRAGIGPVEAGEIYRPLLAGAASNLAALGPEAALTGAIRRGDVATVTAHLSRLEGRERRLYCDLGMVALGLARSAGLAPAAADAVVRVLAAG